MTVPNSFSAITSGSGVFTRRFGGSAIDAVDPYITGYFFMRFAHFPNLIPMLNQQFSAVSPYSSLTDIKNALQSSCNSVTIPQRTVNKTDFMGLGGISFSYPTNVTTDNTITMRFVEWQGAPIYMIFASWVKLISDYRAGVATVTTKSEFAASMYYWTTAADGVSVATAYCMTGLFPLRSPMDQFSHDLSANDKLETDIDFSVDVVYEEPWVYTKCQGYADEYYSLYGGATDDSSEVNSLGELDSGSN